MFVFSQSLFIMCSPHKIATEPESKNSWKRYDVYLGNLRRVGKKQKKNWVYMPPPCTSSWLLCVAKSLLPILPYSSTKLTCTLKRGIRSIMWSGKLFGILQYLLCKHITGCKSTFGTGCVLLKHYQDLENQTGCSFSIIAKSTVETATQARGHLRTTGIWPCTSWGAKGLVSALCHTQLWPEELFWNPPTFEAYTAYSTYIYIKAHEILGGEKYDRTILYIYIHLLLSLGSVCKLHTYHITYL